ncbi:MAG: hypothetical protein IIU90_00090 [Bacteroidaceae bacterium]|nr:hypothetical protein [Bacteroidaceae bacterium]
MTLTQEQYDKLKPLEGHFRTAVKANYKRATTRAEDELVINTLKELGKSPHTTPSCGRCSFLNFQQLGKIYLEYTPQPQQPKKTRTRK